MGESEVDWFSGCADWRAVRFCLVVWSFITLVSTIYPDAIISQYDSFGNGRMPAGLGQIIPSYSDILDAMTATTNSGGRREAITPGRVDAMVRNLAQFRYGLRRFLRFSEDAARRCKVTPQQHQLMLGIEGYTGRESASVTELAEFLQERHHSVVGLVERAVQSGLVRRTQDAADRRVVNVTLTARGRRILLRLTRMHYEEAQRLRGLWETCEMPSGTRATKKPVPARSKRRS
jgi:DNA-binding MarR family transcriptional regulator